MYIERKFENWIAGLVHLAIVIVMPIFPVAIYMITKGQSDSYLYVLFLTVIFSFAYEFTNGYIRNCSLWIKIETIVCTATLILMFLATVFLLYLSLEAKDGSLNFGVFNIILLSLFIVPIIVTIIEIVRSIVYDIEAGKFSLDENNLKGAFKV